MTGKSTTAIVCLSPFFGGMEMDAIRYAKLLSGSVDIILIAKHNSPIDVNFQGQVEHDNIVLETIRFSRKFSFSIIFGMRKLLKKYKIRNVIFFGASELGSLYFSFLYKDINLIIRHGTTKSQPKKDLLHKIIYSKVNWHIPICQHIANNISYIIPFGKRTRVKVIYPSLRYLPGDLSSRKNRGDNTITLLNVSRIAGGKGHVDAIEACKVLVDNHIPFKFICVGDIDPNYHDTIQKAVEEKPYRSNIDFPGFSDKVTDYYLAADIFIFPSKGEGLSNSFIEALAHGLVCIAYANTSFPELKQAGFEFFMAKDGDIDDLKSALRKAVSYTRTHDMPIQHNIKLAQNKFSSDRERRELLELLL